MATHPARHTAQSASAEAKNEVLGGELCFWSAVLFFLGGGGSFGGSLRPGSGIGESVDTRIELFFMRF